jgi:hypothetical protein
VFHSPTWTASDSACVCLVVRLPEFHGTIAARPGSANIPQLEQRSLLT